MLRGGVYEDDKEWQQYKRDEAARKRRAAAVGVLDDLHTRRLEIAKNVGISVGKGVNEGKIPKEDGPRNLVHYMNRTEWALPYLTSGRGALYSLDHYNDEGFRRSNGAMRSANEEEYFRTAKDAYEHELGAPARKNATNTAMGYKPSDSMSWYTAPAPAPAPMDMQEGGGRNRKQSRRRKNKSRSRKSQIRKQTRRRR